jgi:hypothetical protein
VQHHVVKKTRDRYTVSGSTRASGIRLQTRIFRDVVRKKTRETIRIISVALERKNKKTGTASGFLQTRFSE